MICPSLPRLAAMSTMEARSMLKILAGTPTKWGANSHRKIEYRGSIEENQANLEPRTTSSSRCRLIIPVKTHLATYERYIKNQGTLRIGRILEDLDLGAVIASYRHNKRAPPQNEYFMSLVTAAVDKMVIYKPFTAPEDGDLLIDAHVSWVGWSSIEVTERILQNREPILDAKFLMVARHSSENKAVPVNPLVAETEEEQAELLAGQKANEKRKEESKRSLLCAPPDSVESQLMHLVFKDTIDTSQLTYKRPRKDKVGVWMKDARLKSCVDCHPENRNIYGKIFGGFVMRVAFELSWSCAYLFVRKTVQPVFIDDVAFRRPVSIGDLLFFSTQITYTGDNLIMVRCHAEVEDARELQRFSTNEFYFLFAAIDKCGSPAEVPQVLPYTYAEYLLYLDGKRHYDYYKNIVKQNQNSLKETK